MKPKISIIIPCYNQGLFLKEALESVLQCDKALYELIIVNDGSTDDYTNRYTKELANQGYHVVFQDNKGLAGARNAGINQARGEYILPLDADNKVRKEYLTRAIEVFESNSDIAVVYGNALYFGERAGIWKVGEFNLQRLMLYNYIDACAVIRKSVLEKTGLYDTEMEKQCLEDWDLWLRIGFAGYDFRYIDEILFDYRIVHNSMSKVFTRTYANPNLIEKYIHSKYPKRMGHEWIVKHYVGRFKKNPFLFTGKLILRTYFHGYYKRLLNKNKIRSGL
jgi:glycosyltransferase involved in cell wall biosynthesis